MPWLTALRYDARFACRAVLRSPSVSAAAVLTLALGVGLNTAIFSVVESLLLRQLPYGAPDRIAALTLLDSTGAPGGRVNAWLVRQVAARARTLDGIAIHGDSQLVLHDAGDTEVLRGTRVSAGYFDTLGVHMLLGRTFQRGEDRLDPTPMLILTYDFWTRRFGQDSTIVDRALNVDGVPYRVIGVLPERFDPLRMTNGAKRPEFFAPASYDCDPCGGVWSNSVCLLGATSDPGSRRPRESRGDRYGRLSPFFRVIRADEKLARASTRAYNAFCVNRTHPVRGKGRAHLS